MFSADSREHRGKLAALSLQNTLQKLGRKPAPAQAGAPGQMTNELAPDVMGRPGKRAPVSAGRPTPGGRPGQSPAGQPGAMDISGPGIGGPKGRTPVQSSRPRPVAKGLNPNNKGEGRSMYLFQTVP